MDIDFTALASRVAARAEVVGCVILSRDGLVLGAFPPGGERDVTPAWLRFASVGDPERGFVEFSGELWAYVRRGAYAAFAVGESGTRAGILIDYLEQALLAAEDSRDQRAAVRTPETVDLNREHFGSIRPAERIPQPVTGQEHASAGSPTTMESAPPPPPQHVYGSAAGEPSSGDAPQSFGDRPPPPPPPAPTDHDASFGPVSPGGDGDETDPSQQPPTPEDIDRVALAREFAQLLQDGPFGAEEGA
jgi:hypothetical protein